MTVFTLPLLAASLLYQNDFTTRTSASGTGPGLAWSTYRYAKGQPAAYNFNGFGSNKRTRPYSWQPEQDGWTKLFSVSGNQNYMGSHITDEADPCMVFSCAEATVNGVSNPATYYQAYIAHTFRNVFTSGTVKLQVDFRQPLLRHGSDNIICWFRPMLQDGIKLDSSDSTWSVIDVGMAAGSLTGGWRATSGDADGARTYYNYGSGLAKAGHWYRHYITIHLDTNTVDFDVYDLGTARIGMDAAPSGSPAVTRTDCVSRYNVSGGTHGGLSGFSVNIQNLNTEGFYGEEGFNADYAYMMDNVKGSYKATGSDEYVEFYRNDFTTSKRRTVDGSIGSSYSYTLDEPVTVTETYTARDFLVRKITDYGTFNNPFLSSVYNTNGTFNGAVQDPGADGWRLMGATSFKAPVFLTTNGANKVFSITTFGKNIQPMCPEVTSGVCKFEMDVRMPKGFNGTPRCEFDLCSEYAYLNCNDYIPLVRVGVGASDGQSDGYSVTTPNLKRGIFGAGTYYGADGGKSYGINKWYRIRATINLDTKVYDIDVYEIGDNAPANPDDFVPTNENQMLHRFGLSISNFSGDHTGIGSFAVCNWVQAASSSDGNDAQQFQMFFDNMRFWKQNGENWDLLYSNTGDQTKRTYTIARKSIVDENNLYIDRPEYCLDGFNVCPTENNPTYITGANHALRMNGSNYTSLSLPLGRDMRTGVLEFQYDVRLPYDVDYNTTFQMCLGGGQLGSVSILPSTNPQRFNTGYAIDTGIYNDGQTHANGVKNVFRGVCFEGSGNSKWYFTMNSAAHAAGKWIRVKVRADLNHNNYGIAFYDMGSVHPDLDTPDGTCIKDWSNSRIAFRWTTDPISHIWFTCGQTPSFMPWHDEAYGALLLDNIKVTHDKSGLLLLFR